MAIIKCPECGRQVSDKAPTCPSCGVEIAGKVIKCPHCGEVYFRSLEMCPNCHEMATVSGQPKETLSSPVETLSSPVEPVASQVGQVASAVEPVVSPAVSAEKPAPSASPSESAAPKASPVNHAAPKAVTPAAVPPPVPPSRVVPDPRRANDGAGGPGQGNPPEKKGNKGIFVISLVFAILVCGIMYYFYDSANRNKEQEAYEYAMHCDDPTVLQSYLDTYKDADQAHRDSILSHLDQLKQVDQDWTNALVSNSKEALESYLQKYPDSPHKKEAWDKIDSIDWVVAKAADNVDAYQAYLDAHGGGAGGSHIEEAENALKKAKSRDLQPEEKQMVSDLFRQFFQNINSRNADGLTATCEDILSSLLGKNSATKADVVTFMDRLYKADVANMNWHINNDYQIKKREVGEEDYEYQVQFSARQDIDQTDGNKRENLFKISAIVSPAGKISSFNMNKVSMEE